MRKDGRGEALGRFFFFFFFFAIFVVREMIKRRKMDKRNEIKEKNRQKKEKNNDLSRTDGSTNCKEVSQDGQQHDRQPNLAVAARV